MVNGGEKKRKILQKDEDERKKWKMKKDEEDQKS